MAPSQLRASASAAASNIPSSILPPPTWASAAAGVGRISAVASGTRLRSECAYESVLPEILAVRAEHLLPLDVDVMGAITIVSDALPGLFALLADADAPTSGQREKEGAELHVEQLEQLEQYTLALGHAHLLYCGSFRPELGVTVLAAELAKVRDSMLAHAEALAVAGLLDGARLQRIALHGAHRALAGDVIALCAAFKDHWPQLEDKTPYTLAEQSRLVRLSLDLLAALGAKEPAVSGDESSLNRQRAFTLFASAYERARAVVQRLRADAGDAERFAPALSARRRSTPVEESESEPITLVSGAPRLVNG